MIVAPVDNGDLHRLAAQCARASEPAEAGADDYHAGLVMC
jgi:hypothetical protein